ncbi:MAG: outer rane autotransporter barrel domain protein [Firmicutes bacterium]|nr:outer rane autotransporter barrel domain protein [Bacillota bacterium]MBP2657084.1 outer rane autotransporter barrel domain protein [Bacillota bacterium]
MLRQAFKSSFASWQKQLATAVICGATLLFGFIPVDAESQQVKDWNNSLVAIDVQIQSQGASPIKTVSGQSAANIVPGVTDVLLEQKRQILLGAGFNNFAANNYYNNFYSFTSTPGMTDTSVRIVETDQALKLVRRGNHQKLNEITQGFLGAWWSGKYYSVEESRNDQAILAGWGSDLQDIYVISVPKGTQLIGGIASPMAQGSEYRSGGAYQYWKRSGQPENTMPWLMYALYAPNYMSSYSGAITNGQNLSRGVIDDLGLHMNELRNSHVAEGKLRNDIWVSPFGNDASYTNLSGYEYHGQTKGMQLGWEKLIKENAIGKNNKIYFGLVAGHGVTSQHDTASNVNNEITGNYGGIYSVLLTPIESNRSGYVNAAFLFGNLNFANNVPGYYGYGLKQQYSGRLFVTSLEHGVTFQQKNGLVLEPQVQLSYIGIRHGEFTDNVGADVSLKKGDSLQGRLGLQLRKTVEQSNGKLTTTSLGVSYIHEFKGNNVADISGEQSQNSIGCNMFQMNLGLQARLDNHLSLQGEISKLFGDKRGCQGNLSLKVDW